MTKEEHNMDLNSEKNEIWQFVGPKINCFSISFEWFGVKKIFQNKHVDFSHYFFYLKALCVWKEVHSSLHYWQLQFMMSCLKNQCIGSVFSKKLITSWLHLLWEIWKVVSFICLVDMDIFQSLKLYKCQIESKKY